jgi:hypothetical protein
MHYYLVLVQYVVYLFLCKTHSAGMLQICFSERENLLLLFLTFNLIFLIHHVFFGLKETGVLRKSFTATNNLVSKGSTYAGIEGGSK